jgi:hypothetical protein
VLATANILAGERTEEPHTKVSRKSQRTLRGSFSGYETNAWYGFNSRKRGFGKFTYYAAVQSSLWTEADNNREGYTCFWSEQQNHQSPFHSILAGFKAGTNGYRYGTAAFCGLCWYWRRNCISDEPRASGDDARGTNDEVRAAYQGYAAYFGTYRVDPKKGLVVHQVEGSLMPSYTGTDQPRPFRIDHDLLTIEGNDSAGVHFLRQLRRVH